MLRSACLVVGLICLSGAVSSQEKSTQIPADGVYDVLRESVKEKDVLPLKDSEVLVVNRHPYLKKGANEPVRYLVIRSAPDVQIDLASEPKAVKEGGDVVRILLKLRPKAALALEKLTTDRTGKHVAIVLGMEVVTMHKIREPTKGGEVQITSCAPGAANFLMKQLEGHYAKKGRG